MNAALQKKTDKKTDSALVVLLTYEPIPSFDRPNGKYKQVLLGVKTFNIL